MLVASKVPWRPGGYGVLIAAEQVQARQVCSSRNSGYLGMKYHDQKSNVEGISPREKEGNGRGDVHVPCCESSADDPG